MDTISFTSDRFPTKDPNRSFTETSVLKIEGLWLRLAEETLAVEEPLEIQLVHGPADARSMKSISVTMRTPGDDFELAAGFLMTEGVVRDMDDFEQIVYAAENMAPTHQRPASSYRAPLPYQPRKNIVRVELAADVKVSLANPERNFYTTSSCGICGKASLLALQTFCPPSIKNSFSVNADLGAAFAPAEGAERLQAHRRTAWGGSLQCRGRVAGNA